MRKYWVALATCWGFFPSAHAADTVQYGPAPAWVKPIVRPADDATMAEAPAKVLLRNYQLKFTPTGLDIYTESFVRLQTAQGLQALGSLALPWKPETDVLTVHKLHLIRGGEIIDIIANGQKFEVLRRENNLEYAALDGTLTASIQPNGMEVGDVVDIAYSVRREGQLSIAPEFVLGGFGEAPMSRVEMRATWDKSVPLRWRATDEVKGIKESRTGSQIELTWSADNLAPVTQPINVPPRFWKEPRVVFSGNASWNDVSRKLGPLYSLAAQLSANSPLRAEAKTIAAATSDPVARLEAALKLTQDRVRYVYLGMGDGGINPASVDATWQRRFGDCKAKSALLIALLRELGIQADPVAVHTVAGDTLGDLLPIVGGFDHVIVRAQAAGKTYWLDGAGSGTWRRADLAIPNYLWGLPLTERGDGLLRMLAEPAADPQVVTDVFIDAKAGLYIDAPFKAQKQFRGLSGAQMHAELSALPVEGREQVLRKFWKVYFDFVTIKKVTADYDQAAGVETLKMEGTADMDWGGYSYTTDGTRVGAPADFSREPGINADAPFVVQHPFYSVVKERIELPPVGTFTTKGENYDVSLAGSHHLRHAKIENRIFTGESSMRSLLPEVTAAEARAAEKQLNDMWTDTLRIIARGYFATDADVAALRARTFTDASNLVWRGNIFLDRRDYDAAFADFNAAIKLDDKNHYALADRGLVHFWRANYPLAQADFEAVLAKEPGNEVALRGMGLVHRVRGEIPEAIEWLSKSLRSDPENTFALANRAYCYLILDDKPKALADAATAIRLQPDYVDMYDLRVRLLGAQEEKAPAIREVQAMLAASPDNLAALKSAAQSYSHLGRHQDALTAANRVIAQEPKAENYLLRELARDPADFAGRMADIDAVLAMQPGHKRAVGQRSRLQSESGDHKGAIEAYSTQLKADAKMAERRRLWTLRGIEYAKVGQEAASRRDFAAALSDYPDGDSYNLFCWELTMARVNLEAALVACEKALTVAPKDPVYQDTKGLVLLQLGRFDESIVAYDAALAAKPKRETSLFGRGLAKKRRCKCGAGDADITAAQQSDPAIVRVFALAGLKP